MSKDMKSTQFHVWITQDGEYKVMDTTGANTLEEVNKKLGASNLGWYGCDAFSPEEAIAMSKAAGLKQRTPEEINRLESEALDLEAQMTEWNTEEF